MSGAGYTAYHHHTADAHVLVKYYQATGHGKIAHLTVTAKSSAVGQYYPIAHAAIMGNMDIIHKETIVTNSGETIACICGAGDKLSQCDAIAHNHTGRLIFITEILRLEADTSTGKNIAIITNSGVSVNHGMGTNLGAGTNLDIGADNGIWSYLRRVVYFGAIADDGSGVDTGH